MKYTRLYIALLLLSTSSAYGSRPILIVDSISKYTLVEKYLDVLEDKSKKLSIDDVSSAAYTGQFYENPDYYARNLNRASAYWVRFSVKDATTQPKRWLIELYDFRADHVEIYMPDGKGGFKKVIGGDIYPFEIKEYQHKNFIYEIPKLHSGEAYYIRVVSITLFL